MKTFYRLIVVGVSATVLFSCKRIQVAEINTPFAMEFGAPAASEDTTFELETAVDATDYPEFDNNKEKLQTLSLTRASSVIDEVRSGTGAVMSLSLYVSDTSRNYHFLTEWKDFELRAGGARELPLDEAAKNRLAEWIRASPHKIYFKIMGSSNSAPFDATFRIKLEVNQKLKVLI